MRVWLLALFLIAFNVGVGIVSMSNFWYSAFDGQRYDFATGTWYTPEDTSVYFPMDVNLSKATSDDDAKSAALNIGPSWVSGMLTILVDTAGALKIFWNIIVTIFTSTQTLLLALGFPSYLATAVQTLINLVIIYGGIQFFMGRSGKTIE